MILARPLLLVFLSGIASREAIAEPPVCLAGEGKECGPCGLYLAESTVDENRLAYFTGVNRPAGSPVGPNDLLLSIVDANKNEYSPWHDMVWDPAPLPEALLENNFSHDLFLGGVSTLASCGGQRRSNLASPSTGSLTESSSDVHRSTDPTAGSFSYRGNVQMTSQPMNAGDEIFLDCEDGDFDEHTITKTIRTLPWLEKYGICADTLTVAPSTLPGVGRGAFVQRPVAQGDVIVASPMLPLDRSQLEIVQQEYKTNSMIPFAREHGIVYDAHQVVGRQLLENYVYGRADSNVLLLPTAPGINFLNHHSEQVNAYIRWSSRLGNNEYLMSLPVMELFELDLGGEGELVMELVALRDLSVGEEVFIDYGKEWADAWEKHVHQWKSGHERDYVSAAEYRKLHLTVNGELAQPFRTEQEQEKEPYPENLQTACYYVHDENKGESSSDQQVVTWSSNSKNTVSTKRCLRPCRITERTGDTKIGYSYSVVASDNHSEGSQCGRIPDGGVVVSQVPADAIALVDKPYTSDTYMPTAFRHSIGVPESFYPRNWLAVDPKPDGDFIASPLSPGAIAPIRWQGSAKVVTPWAFRVGIPKQVRLVLLDYCDKMGITDIFRHVTSKGNGLEIGQNGFLDLDGEKWYLQRPNSDWRSNLHWLSPGDTPAHEDYLQALSVAGFDEVLDGVGKYLGMDGLVAFHVTFIAVSQSTRGYLHHDVLSTGAKTYNVIIPLLLANETGPELDLVEGASYEEDYIEEEAQVGRYRYEYEVGSMMGDGAVHATSSVDYRVGKEMRMAATVYIADVNELNADAILNEYTQAFPPNDRKLLLSWAGRHWKKDDPSIKLPEPRKDHILVRTQETASN